MSGTPCVLLVLLFVELGSLVCRIDAEIEPLLQCCLDMHERQIVAEFVHTESISDKLLICVEVIDPSVDPVYIKVSQVLAQCLTAELDQTFLERILLKIFLEAFSRCISLLIPVGSNACHGIVLS